MADGGLCAYSNDWKSRLEASRGVNGLDGSRRDALRGACVRPAAWA